MVIRDTPASYGPSEPVIVTVESHYTFVMGSYNTVEAAVAFCENNDLPIAKNIATEISAGPKLLIALAANFLMACLQGRHPKVRDLIGSSTRHPTGKDTALIIATATPI